MFIITHRATGAVAALLIAALGALSLGETPVGNCEFTPASPAAMTAALAPAAGQARQGMRGSP